MESEILMYVVAKATEPSGTTITLASAQGDSASVRFAADEQLSDVYQVGDGAIVTVQPLMHRADLPTFRIASAHPSLPSPRAKPLV